MTVVQFDINVILNFSELLPFHRSNTESERENCKYFRENAGLPPYLLCVKASDSYDMGHTRQVRRKEEGLTGVVAFTVIG